MSDTHRGRCFCGAVEIEVTGVPEVMGYCHCTSCRSWAAAPLIAFTLWKPDKVRVTKGKEFLGSYMKTVEDDSDRQYCTRCGGHLMTDHPDFGIMDVYAATIPSIAFKASCHLNYPETVLPMKDGLPKFRDYPVELGGSGEKVSE